MDDFNVVTTSFCVVTNPVGGRSTANEHEFVLGQMEQDAVADYMAAMANWHILFGAVNREIGERIDGSIGQQFDGVRAFDVDVHHVMALIEQYSAVAPCILFTAPVVEFRGYYRIYVSADLGIAQQVNRVTCSI